MADHGLGPILAGQGQSFERPLEEGVDLPRTEDQEADNEHDYLPNPDGFILGAGCVICGSWSLKAVQAVEQGKRGKRARRNRARKQRRREGKRLRSNPFDLGGKGEHGITNEMHPTGLGQHGEGISVQQSHDKSAQGPELTPSSTESSKMYLQEHRNTANKSHCEIASRMERANGVQISTMRSQKSTSDCEAKEGRDSKACIDKDDTDGLIDCIVLLKDHSRNYAAAGGRRELVQDQHMHARETHK